MVAFWRSRTTGCRRTPSNLPQVNKFKLLKILLRLEFRKILDIMHGLWSFLFSSINPLVAQFAVERIVPNLSASFLPSLPLKISTFWFSAKPAPIIEFCLHDPKSKCGNVLEMPRPSKTYKVWRFEFDFFQGWIFFFLVKMGIRTNIVFQAFT